MLFIRHGQGDQVVPALFNQPFKPLIHFSHACILTFAVYT